MITSNLISNLLQVTIHDLTWLCSNCCCAGYVFGYFKRNGKEDFYFAARVIMFYVAAEYTVVVLRFIW